MSLEMRGEEGHITPVDETTDASQREEELDSLGIEETGGVRISAKHAGDHGKDRQEHT